MSSPVSGWDDNPKPRAVEGGLKARSARGAIGEQWWSRRFVDVLESFEVGTRLTRGKRYARAGQVMDLAVTPGSGTRRVQGSRVRPYRVRIDLRQVLEADWRRIEEGLAAQAVFRAAMLAGEMPTQIEEV